MAGETRVREVRWGEAPDARRAVALLGEICGKTPVCRPRAVDKPLVLYGAGKLGRMAREYFDRIGVPVQFVVDRDAELHAADPFWKGVDILRPDAVAPEDKETALLAVCVATVPFTVLQRFLSGEGWLDLVPFYDVAEAYKPLHPLGNGWFADRFDDEGRAATEAVLGGWSDDCSRAHHLQFIAWHYLREEWFFESAPVTTGDRYFIPEILSVLHDRERFLDGGAHIGDTAFRFMELVERRFDSLWAIEPDKEQLRRLREKVEQSGAGSGRFQIVECALGDCCGSRAFFSGLGYASQLSELGSAPVEVKRLDDLRLVPTFVKFHLEGGEYDAVKGGLGTLKRSRPILAVTTYHNPLGLWRLPRLLMEELPGYDFHLRQHSWSDTGATMYALPRERYLTNP